jgi:hypothetical protein
VWQTDDLDYYLTSCLPETLETRDLIFNDLPKVNELKQMFPDLYRNDPVLSENTR